MQPGRRWNTGLVGGRRSAEGTSTFINEMLNIQQAQLKLHKQFRGWIELSVSLVKVSIQKPKFDSFL